MNKLTLDLSGCYYKDILVGDLLYVIGDDRFYKITKVEFNESWIILYSGSLVMLEILMRLYQKLSLDYIEKDMLSLLKFK